MTLFQQLSLLWKRFSPLEEKLIAAVRDVLPLEAKSIYDAQVAAITRVQRSPGCSEICFYPIRKGKVDWINVPSFPSDAEFQLAEVCFQSKGKHYKATLYCVGGHIFSFGIRSSPKSIAFDEWEGAPHVRLLNDPLSTNQHDKPEIPKLWAEFLMRSSSWGRTEWTFHGADDAYRINLEEGEFLVLAECEGDQFILYRIDPPSSKLYYLPSHEDQKPQPIKGELDKLFEERSK